jgi:UDP-N-acetylglucosamine 2-epimerase
MRPGQTLSQSASRIIAELEPVLAAEKPDTVIVQGDTTTTLCASLAAFYCGIPVAHVEAGLRTGDLHEPFPEEMNRVLTGKLAAIHFAATAGAAQNLYNEGFHRSAVVITGNTGIDAVMHIKGALEAGTLQVPDEFHAAEGKKLIVVTAHRRESFGAGLERICGALLRLARRNDIQIVYPVHPNPSVSKTAQRLLGGHPNISLLSPLDYVPFVALMCRAYLLLTDSGGIQEEAPSLGTPVLVLREKTERPDAVVSGTSRLVGTDEERIVQSATELLDDPVAYRAMAVQHNPFGDGHASRRIADTLAGKRRFVVEFSAERPVYAELPGLVTAH